MPDDQEVPTIDHVDQLIQERDRLAAHNVHLMNTNRHHAQLAELVDDVLKAFDADLDAGGTDESQNTLVSAIVDLQKFRNAMLQGVKASPRS